MAGEPERKTVRLRIVGRVQGVGYRAWVLRRAKTLGLTGWVRNLTDGAVECVAQGAPDAIAALAAACHAGPTIARVTDVNSEEVAAAEIFAAFEQRPAATPG